MSSFAEMLRREAVYLWYYLDIQLRQILPYWALGILIGSALSVFLKKRISDAFCALSEKPLGILGIPIAAALGIASPLCMYGTIPIAASFAKGGVSQDWLAAFMMCSVLLNPQLIVYSAALGTVALLIRVMSCFLCGVTAGLLIRYLFRQRGFFTFEGFGEPQCRDDDPNILRRYAKNVWRNLRATGLYFLVGIMLSVLFQRYVPETLMTELFGGSKAWGVLMAATIGVPLYACGGGTIPLLQGWLIDGMSIGSAAAFMITGPATKITNLGALKIVLGAKRFAAYILYIMLFSVATGLVCNMFFNF